MKAFFIAATLLAFCKVSAQDTITKTMNGKEYTLVSHGDMVPVLYTGNSPVSQKDLARYEAEVSELELALAAKRSAQYNEDNARRAEKLSAIVAQLVADRLIPSAGELLSLHLDSRSFTVNGRQQPFSVFEKYRQKFVTQQDHVIYYNNPQ